MSLLHWLFLLAVSQRGPYCPPLLRVHWPFSSSTICFVKRAWATLVLRQWETVTGLRDLLHTETFQWFGQLDVVPPAGFLLIWSIRNLLCVFKCESWAATSPGFKMQTTVADTKETWSTRKMEGFVLQTLGFLFALVAKTQDSAF